MNGPCKVTQARESQSGLNLDFSKTFILFCFLSQSEVDLLVSSVLELQGRKSLPKILLHYFLFDSRIHGPINYSKSTS